jgi:hypothetical protein
VTLFDLEHEMTRTLEVEAVSPTAAAEAALRWQASHHRLAEDFGDEIDVEIVTTARHRLSLKSLTTPAQAKVA